jgi:alpha-mannosidase
MDHRIVQKKLSLLESLAVDDSVAMEGWQARIADNPAPGEYVFDGDWIDVELPASFKSLNTVFLRAIANVPASFALANTYLSFQQQSMEGLLRIDGAAYAGVDDNHKRSLAPRAGRLAIELEYHSVPHALFHPEQSPTKGIFSGASVIAVNREVEALCHDVRFAFDTIRIITDPRRKQLLENAVEASLLAVNLTLPRKEFLAEAATARTVLAEKVGAIAPDPEAGSLFAVGHSHIDTAWLWPIRETVRKCGRTFSTACRLMEQYPEFYFSCSQPQLYQYTKDHFPEVYSQIKKWVAAGNWDTTGAMWIEADCNVTSGESLIRQMLYGHAFFKEEFGTRTRICWLPDVFGYPCSLPEILAGCGISFFYTYKLHWQANNPFPDHLFLWRGLDGTEVLAAVVNNLGAYNNLTNPEHLYVSWQRYNQKAEYPEIIFPFGYGDGGGGVTEEMLEWLDRAERPFPGLPSVRTGPPELFFDDVVAKNPDLPTWDGELYVQTHRGTYTTQSALKKANRASELLLREAEIWGAITQAQGRAFDRDVFGKAWKLVLLNQFHDILPGSSIAMVYEDAHRDHAAVRASITPQLDAALGELSQSSEVSNAVRVFNSLSWARRDIFKVVTPPSDADSFELVNAYGSRLPAQLIERHADHNVLAVEGHEIPAVGFADFVVDEGPVGNRSTITVTPELIETNFIRIAITPDGAIASIYDKVYAREVVAAGSVGNDLQLLQDGPEQEDAWNVHDTVGKRRYPFDSETTVSVIESGPIRGMLRVRRTYRDTVLVQDIVVAAKSNRIDFVTTVEWNERHTMLKAAFPLAIRSTRATYEVQFGAIERPTHRNTSWDQAKFEVPAQKWADISESGYGVSLLNDSRYGYDAHDNVLRISLLRSTTWPDPWADKGTHQFTYSLLPHGGSWVEGETVRRAWELNVPMVSRPIGIAGEPKSFVTLSGTEVVMESLKPAEDANGLIIRLYEPHGARGEVMVATDGLFTAVTESNHVEEDIFTIAVGASGFSFQITPFQIRSFRLT